MNFKLISFTDNSIRRLVILVSTDYFKFVKFLL